MKKDAPNYSLTYANLAHEDGPESFKINVEGGDTIVLPAEVLWRLRHYNVDTTLPWLLVDGRLHCRRRARDRRRPYAYPREVHHLPVAELIQLRPDPMLALTAPHPPARPTSKRRQSTSSTKGKSL